MRARRLGIRAILVLATVVATITILAIWAQRLVADTDTWTDTTTELLENENVRNALGTSLVSELFAAAPSRTGSGTRCAPTGAARRAGDGRTSPGRGAQRAEGAGQRRSLEAWRRANERGHILLLKVLRSEKNSQR